MRQSPESLVGFQVCVQTWPQVIIESAVIVKLIQNPWEICELIHLRNPFYPIIIRKSLSKVSGLTSEARYRNLFQESGVVLISSVLLMLLLKVLLKTPLSHLTSAYYLGMLLSCFVFVFVFFSSQSAFSSTLVRFYFESIYSCLNSPVYLIPVKQLADQLRGHYRQPACSKIIQVYLAAEQRDAWTLTGHLVQGRVPSPLHPLLSAELLAALATLGPCFSASGVALWHSPHFVAGSSPAS